MSADLRGFSYAMQPALNRQRWRLDALQARLGAANRAIAQAQGALAQRETALAQRHEALGLACSQRLDPAVLRRGLHWLAAERDQIAELRRALQLLETQRAQVLADFRAQEAKLEALQQHRSGTVADYLQDDQRRASAVADGEWLARQGVARGLA
jgi:hypothetical protein